MIKFADEATITVASGKGGDGCVAFRREKFIPMGGPAGGDGGRGGDVIFEVKRNLRTLAYLRYKQVFRAQNGQPGMGKNMHGRDGEDIVIEVPPGTIIKDAITNEILMDFNPRAQQSASVLNAENARWIFLKGGKGGWGNTRFKNSVNQAPRYAQPGQPGRERKLKIELSLIADIGLVGFPNAGKSSLLDYFTNARPKIASYPFTTKIPNLGVLRVNERDLIIADIPGIIEGAHEGAGLGLRFLKHISRTACLAFMVDLSDENWKTAFPTLLNELEQFSPTLARKPRILLGTKMDLPESEEHYEEFKASFPEETIFGISVISDFGLDAVKQSFFEQVIAFEAKEAGEALEAEEEEPLFDEVAFDDEEPRT